MKAYPFGTPSIANIAISASSATSASFMLAVIPTASVALNITGSQGPSGSTVIDIGSIGVTGPIGPTGSKGLGVYLVSASLAVCCPVETTYVCIGDTSRRTIADGTHNASGCITEVDDIVCGAGGCEENATRCSL